MRVCSKDKSAYKSFSLPTVRPHVYIRIVDFKCYLFFLLTNPFNLGFIMIYIKLFKLESLNIYTLPLDEIIQKGST